MQINVTTKGFNELHARLVTLGKGALKAKPIQAYTKRIFTDAGGKLVRNVQGRMIHDNPALQTGATRRGVRVHQLNSVAGNEILLSYGIRESTMTMHGYNRSQEGYGASSAITQEVGRTSFNPPPVPAIVDWLTHRRGIGELTGKDKNELVWKAMCIARKIAREGTKGNNAFLANSSGKGYWEQAVTLGDFHPEDAAIIDSAFNELADAIVGYLEGQEEV